MAPSILIKFDRSGQEKWNGRKAVRIFLKKKMKIYDLYEFLF